jgi:A/G-specific adenine glycosylase
MPSAMTDTLPLAPVRRSLMTWFRSCARDLPWRRTRDPYAIWVSEIMLQQTQVATVVDYYRRFLERFPTVEALAAARLEAVLKAWEGLGYYGRARHLHAAAGKLVAENGGKLPRTAEELRRLSGIGRYTAGAIASIAFDLDEPVLDGNVIRVLCRLTCLDADPAAPAVAERLWTMARELIPPGQAGQFNQAMMELGAMICRPRRPACGTCPLARQCLARRAGRQEELPVKAAKKASPHYTVAVGAVYRRGRILIARRPAKGLLGGLWELPGGKQRAREPLEETCRREVREETGVAVRVGREIAVVNHAYTHFSITMHAFCCQHLSGEAQPLAAEAVRWVWPSQLSRYPFPRANLRVLEALAKQS